MRAGSVDVPGPRKSSPSFLILYLIICDGRGSLMRG